MNYLIVICSIVVGAFAFVMMADVSGSGSSGIDFKTATAEERQAWMDDKAQGLKTAARFFLPSGRGPMALNFYLNDIVTRPEARQMEIIVDVKVPYGAEVGVIPKLQFLESFCKNYVKLGFYKQKIQLTVSFQNKKNRDPITRISVQPYDCQWHAQESS